MLGLVDSKIRSAISGVGIILKNVHKIDWILNDWVANYIRQKINNEHINNDEILNVLKFTSFVKESRQLFYNTMVTF